MRPLAPAGDALRRFLARCVTCGGEIDRRAHVGGGFDGGHFRGTGTAARMRPTFGSPGAAIATSTSFSTKKAGPDNGMPRPRIPGLFRLTALW
jgi:hypothetical protein